MRLFHSALAVCLGLSLFVNSPIMTFACIGMVHIDKEYQEETDIEENRDYSEEDPAAATPSVALHTMGYIDVEYEANLIENSNSAGLLGEAIIPASYSSIESGYTSGIKDQSQSGLCWAFSYTSASESNMLRTGKSEKASCEYSPLGIGYFFYNVPQDPLRLIGAETENTVTATGKNYLNIGGSYLVTAFALSGWIGPVNESDIPFSAPYGGDESTVYEFDDYKPAAVQTGAYFLNSSETNEIKKAIMQYGAASVGIRASDSLYSYSMYGHVRNNGGEEDFFVYHPYSGTRDHEVQIVGWDDTIPKAMFETDTGKQPMTNGGWLIRNSWGEDWPFDGASHPGCFWISYEDCSIHQTAVVLEMEDGDHWYHNYHYDGNASTSSMNLRSAAAIFQAQTTETVTDINIGFKDSNVDYSVSVYTSTDKPAAPAFGTLVSEKSGCTVAEGFYTVHLDTPVDVEANEWFSVVVETTGPADYYCESSKSAFGERSVRMTADINPGEGFVCADGSNWQDGYTLEVPCMPRIKAFTQSAGKYLVRWENADGTALQLDQDVLPGEIPVYRGETPVLPSSAGYDYTFKGWDKSISAVDGDQIYKATYEKSVRTYTVVWKNYDGTVLETDNNVPYGTVPAYDSAEPERKSDTEYDYEFVSWEPEVKPVTKDISYTAVFKTTKKKYPITWLDDLGNLIGITEVAYGELPVQESPRSDGRGIFAGWVPAVTAVTGPAVYRATVSEYPDGIIEENGQLKYYLNNKLQTQVDSFVRFAGNIYRVRNGIVPKDATGLIKDPMSADWYYCVSGVVQTQCTGLCDYNGSWFYVKEGKFESTAQGFVDYNGSQFYVGAGQVMRISGLVQDPSTGAWYFLSKGQIQKQYTGLAQYDGAWFYVNSGKLNTTLGGFVDYNGGKFFLAAGEIKRNISGLCQDPQNPSVWYFLANGEVQNQYTGLCQYNGAWFYVIAGRFATEFTGRVEYNGSWFNVVNGEVK